MVTMPASHPFRTKCSRSGTVCHITQVITTRQEMSKVHEYPQISFSEADSGSAASEPVSHCTESRCRSGYTVNNLTLALVIFHFPTSHHEMSYGGFFPPAHYLSCHSCYIVISELIWVNTLPCLADESIWRPDQKNDGFVGSQVVCGFSMSTFTGAR